MFQPKTGPTKELISSRDRILTRASVAKEVPADPKDGVRACAIASLILAISAVPYSCAVLSWTFLWRKSLVQYVLAILLLLFVPVVLLAASWKWSTGRDRRSLRLFGVLFLQGILAGVLVGFFMYYHYLCYYWKYKEMRTYTNVGAAQSARAFGDGSMFLFTQDTRLDSSRAVGYESRWTGQHYCVAPIIDSTMTQADPINYWAVGENCCNPRAEFHCDDAKDPIARTALVLLQPEDVVSPLMIWATTGSSYGKYINALKLEESAYYTQAPDKLLLMRWTRNPIKLQNSFLWGALKLWLYVSLVYVPLVFIGGYILARVELPTMKKEGIIGN